jgi:hypothetical protein
MISLALTGARDQIRGTDLDKPWPARRQEGRMSAATGKSDYVVRGGLGPLATQRPTFTPLHLNVAVCPETIVRFGPAGRQQCGTKRTLTAISMMAASGPLRTFVDGAANGSKEPRLPNAAQRSNGSNAGQSGPSMTARYAYF